MAQLSYLAHFSKQQSPASVHFPSVLPRRDDTNCARVNKQSGSQADDARRVHLPKTRRLRQQQQQAHYANGRVHRWNCARPESTADLSPLLLSTLLPLGHMSKCKWTFNCLHRIVTAQQCLVAVQWQQLPEREFSSVLSAAAADWLAPVLTEQHQATLCVLSL